MIRATTALCLAALTALPAWAVELVMVEQPGCIYCERWDDEIAPIYPKTAEGKFAPLQRVNIRAVDDLLATSRRVVFTPTFIVVDDGRELARLEGYPGRDFFWPLLDQILQEFTEFEGVPE
tara:strand:+ start:39746 stop:40108 length:363 start_codon:yes stop_codon:yes gene_type:complete